MDSVLWCYTVNAIPYSGTIIPHLAQNFKPKSQICSYYFEQPETAAPCYSSWNFAIPCGVSWMRCTFRLSNACDTALILAENGSCSNAEWSISIVIFMIMNSSKLIECDILGAVIRVALCVILCFTGFIIAGRLLKKPNAMKNHPWAVKFFIAGFIVLLVIWSMSVSVANYVQHQQLLTFYTVELVAVLFVKLHPVFTTVTIFGSYILNYLILTFGFEGNAINPYNYMMLAVMSAAGAFTRSWISRV